MDGIRKNIIWKAPGETALITSEIPQIEEGEVLVKVDSCGFCGSDLKIIKFGNARVAVDRIIGHEIAGVIAESKTEKFKVGDRIAVGADVPCGECYFCTHEMSNCCEINYAIGHQFEGGFNQYIKLNKLTVDGGPVNKLPDDMPFEHAAMAEPLACCINGYEVANAKYVNTVVIFGAGPIGMMLAALAPTYGATKTIVIDPNQKRLDKVKELGLATHIINPSDGNVTEQVMQITEDWGAELVFTATTAYQSHEMAIPLVARRGVVNLFGGLPKDSPDISLNSNFIHYREAYITGSHGSTPAQNKKALDLIYSKELDVTPFITHTFSIDEFDLAHQMAASGDAIKVIVKPNA